MDDLCAKITSWEKCCRWSEWITSLSAKITIYLCATQVNAQIIRGKNECTFGHRCFVSTTAFVFFQYPIKHETAVFPAYAGLDKDFILRSGEHAPPPPSSSAEASTYIGRPRKYSQYCCATCQVQACYTKTVERSTS